MTRKDYLNGGDHRAYYGQYVHDGIKSRLLIAFGRDKLTDAFVSDEHFNTIPLAQWDAIPLAFNMERMRANGDYLTKAGKVCILKEAARQIVEVGA